VLYGLDPAGVALVTLITGDLARDHSA
jgi:hypothetical protein